MINFALARLRHCLIPDKLQKTAVESRYLNYVGRPDSALTLPLISRDPTPCMAETALAMVNI